MLKRFVNPLITLVLALVAASVFSTLCPARETTFENSATVRAAGSVKAMPGAYAGEPDQPLSPAPPRQSGGNDESLDPMGAADGDWVVELRRIIWIWALWFGRGSL